MRVLGYLATNSQPSISSSRACPCCGGRIDSSTDVCVRSFLSPLLMERSCLLVSAFSFGLVGGQLCSGCWYFLKIELRTVSSYAPYTLAVSLEGLAGCCEYTEALKKPPDQCLC